MQTVKQSDGKRWSKFKWMLSWNQEWRTCRVLNSSSPNKFFSEWINFCWRIQWRIWSFPSFFLFGQLLLSRAVLNLMKVDFVSRPVKKPVTIIVLSSKSMDIFVWIDKTKEMNVQENWATNWHDFARGVEFLDWYY